MPFSHCFDLAYMAKLAGVPIPNSYVNWQDPPSVRMTIPMRTVAAAMVTPPENQAASEGQTQTRPLAIVGRPSCGASSSLRRANLEDAPNAERATGSQSNQ